MPLLEQVFERNKETVKIVFKNMPLQFHKLAMPAHRAAMAAGEQGKFWEFHDRLFAAKKLSDKLIDDIAKELQLDTDKLKKDMQSPLVQQRIRKDLNDAQKAGITGTPTVFINGRKLNKRSLQGFQKIIDDELNKLKNQ